MSAYAGDTSGKDKGKQGSNTSTSSSNNNSNEITLSLLDDLGDMSDSYDVDVDDLLSDESENDDLIDNEADLALLLRTHGVTLDDPPPPPAVSRGMSSSYFATTMLAPGASQSAFLPGGPGPSTATAIAPRFQDSSDAQSWMAAMERRYEEELHQQQASPAQPTQSLSFVYIHNHGSTSQSRAHPSIPSSTISTTVTPKRTIALPTTSPARAYAETGIEGDIQVNNRDIAHADLQQGRGSATRAYAPTAQATPAPEPFVMDPEENKRLTGVIRLQTANALEVNRKYQSALEQKLRDIEQAHSRNKKLRVSLTA